MPFSELERATLRDLVNGELDAIRKLDDDEFDIATLEGLSSKLAEPFPGYDANVQAGLPPDGDVGEPSRYVLGFHSSDIDVCHVALVDGDTRDELFDVQLYRLQENDASDSARAESLAALQLLIERANSGRGEASCLADPADVHAHGAAILAAFTTKRDEALARGDTTRAAAWEARMAEAVEAWGSVTPEEQR